MNYENILVATHGKVGVITLNRPKALNALSDGLFDDVGLALDGFEADESISCIVITGSDKAFAAGADISGMKDYGYMDAYKANFITKNWDRVARCRKPLIAAVAGFDEADGAENAL